MSWGDPDRAAPPAGAVHPAGDAACPAGPKVLQEVRELKRHSTSPSPMSGGSTSASFPPWVPTCCPNISRSARTLPQAGFCLYEEQTQVLLKRLEGGSWTAPCGSWRGWRLWIHPLCQSPWLGVVPQHRPWEACAGGSAAAHPQGRSCDTGRWPLSAGAGAGIPVLPPASGGSSASRGTRPRDVAQHGGAAGGMTWCPGWRCPPTGGGGRQLSSGDRPRARAHHLPLYRHYSVRRRLFNELAARISRLIKSPPVWARSPGTKRKRRRAPVFLSRRSRRCRRSRQGHRWPSRHRHTPGFAIGELARVMRSVQCLLEELVVLAAIGARIGPSRTCPAIDAHHDPRALAASCAQAPA